MTKVKSFGLVSLLLAALVATLVSFAGFAFAAQATNKSISDGMDNFDKILLGGEVAFCGNPNLPAPGGLYPPMDYSDGTDYANDNVKKILWLAYGGGASQANAELKDSSKYGSASADNVKYAGTQVAIWRNCKELHTGTGYPEADGPSTRFANWLESKLDSVSAEDAAKVTLKTHEPTDSGFQVVLSFNAPQEGGEDTTEPKIVNTTLKANDKTNKVTVSQGDTVTLVDTVEVSGLGVKKTYTLICEAFNVDVPNEPVASSTLELSGSAMAESEVSVGDITASAVGTFTYSVRTRLMDGDKQVAEHNGEFDVASETVTVEVTEPGPEPEPEPTPEPGQASIGTTIKVGGTEATAGKILQLEGGCYAFITDTVAYEGLTANAAYRIEGKLMEFTGTGANVSSSPVAEGTADFTASSTGEGTCEVSFSNVPLQENAYYVVFEEVYDADNKLVAEHKDANDVKQAVVVKPVDNDWPIIIENPDHPFAPASELSMSTTVSINGQAASGTQARTVSYSDVSKVKNVKDTIQYSGFDPSKTYTIKGMLVDASTGQAIANGTAEAERTADGISGTWEIDFTGITLEAGKKYVVFEYAYDAATGAEVAKHEDLNDKAQTIVVTAKPTSSTSSKTASTTAKTADAAGGVALLALVVAVVAAGTALGARRFEK